MNRTLPWRRRDDDQGAILIIALIIITVVALVTGMVLTRGEGSLRATVKLRNVAGTAYAADGAAQVALNALRTGYWDGNATKPANWAFNNEVGDGCFGRNNTESILTPASSMLISNFYPAPKSNGSAPTSAFVECVPETATGAQGTARHVTNANSPGDAIITLGNNGENGLQNANKVLKVRGGVRSNSNISASGAIEVESANVRARASCSGTISVSAGFTRTCNLGSGPTDPNYPADVVTIPPWQKVPACPGGSTHYVALEPGYYDDAAALNAITASCNKIVWFKPGTYYFDFHNSSGNGDPLFESGITPSSGNTLNLSAGRIIAGTPIDSSGNVLANPPANPTIPGACQNPINDANAQGVQFIFGGDTRVYLENLVELCATYRANRPPIVLYGNKTGDNPTLSTLTGPSGALTTSGTPTVTANTGSDATFTPLTAAALQDDGNGVSTWQRSNGGVNGSEVRTITMGGFTPASSIPKGSVLKQARVIVRHKSAVPNGGTASTIRIAPAAAGAPALNAFNLGRPGALTTETINLKTAHTAIYNALATGIHENGYTGANVEYRATVGRNQSAQLDAVRLELEYYVPQMRGAAAIPTNCTTVIGGSGCNIIDAPANGKAEPYIQGTTYLPLGKVYLNIKNTAAQVFRWGIISRALEVNINGAFNFPGAVIELPDNSPGLGLDGTLVQLKVYVCPGQATCDASGKLALKVRAQLWDESGSTVPGQREVTLLNWSHQR